MYLSTWNGTNFPNSAVFYQEESMQLMCSSNNVKMFQEYLQIILQITDIYRIKS